MTALRLRMTAVLALAGLTLAGLLITGAGTLAAPPIGSWVDAVTWYERVGAEAATIVALRLLAMLGVGWLLVGAALQLVASVSLRHGAQRMADVMSPRVLRHLAHGVANLSVSAGLALPSVIVMPAEDPPGTAVMEVLDDTDESTTTTVAPTTIAAAAPTTTIVVPVPAPPAIPVPAPVEPPADAHVVVEAGDSFWRIAVDVITDARGTPPADGDVDAYWHRLIAANRDRLVDPANADLLFPGQTLTVPSPTA